MIFRDFLRFWLWAFLSVWGIAALANGAAPADPTFCVAAGMSVPAGGAQVGVSWMDNSTTETSWVVAYSVNGGAFSSISVTSGTTATTGLTGVRLNAVLGATYIFKIRASDGTSVSAFTTNSTAITPAAFTLTATPVAGQAVVNLAWPDIANETNYRIYYKLAGDVSYSFLAQVAANTTTYQVTSAAIEPAKSYSFVIEPFVNGILVADSNAPSATVDGMTSKTGTSGTPGSAFSHTFTYVSGFTTNSKTLTGIPAGLSFNSSTGVLSGTYPGVGNYTLTFTANYTGGGSLTQTFYIRVRPLAGAPVVGTVIPVWNGAAGTTRDTTLAGTFTDTEAESAVRVNTTLGNVDFILFNGATPATVTNFMNYVNAGKYTDVAFHRSISGFVVQGGGFKGAGTGSNFSSVVTYAPVVNEPGVANERGTISMAKLGGNPNSATSQFFVSLGDNRANLDYQNGGFTVFGRVAGNGMSVVDSISNLPNSTYSLLLDGSATGTSFANFPMNELAAPASMDQTKLVKMNSVTTVPTLAYSVTGNTNPSVASASIVSGQLHLTGLTGGQTTVTVTATDLDNLTTTQSVTVNLKDTYSAWAARTTFPGGQSGDAQNPDGDAWNNLQEYAFMGNPGVFDPAVPFGFTEVSGAVPPPSRYLTLTFPIRKLTQGLSYVVEANDGLSGTWTEIWKSADGFSHAQVVSALDQEDRTVVTIKDTKPVGQVQKRFLRTRLAHD